MSQRDILKFLYTHRIKPNLKYFTIKEIYIGLGAKTNLCAISKQVTKLRNSGILEMKADLLFTPRVNIKKYYRLRVGQINKIKIMLEIEKVIT